ncbi:DUF1990 domain-containing protein [Rubripirellula amarantea]|uniref:DUF1990 domain-containing protein n=1 Tax=Rubripirellula amarantea TaxID=2527999 RepID=A0A5C5WY87_9BACT|nr:DUF1990 family protein [Rubripirellula amarantea]MDA8745862.1 DUF1990 domain-containing protein [Rubripirellula amarantea]TWT54862.1 hypothetical protein Pla22_25160 [Rubripirellula amarantea]
MNDPWWKTRLSELDALPYNYDASEYVEGQPGWNVDHYDCDLPSESPGPPQPDGPYQIAREILVAYQFPDPSRIVGYFNQEDSLQGRNMVLEAKFLGIRFTFGVRVSKVIDDEQTTKDGTKTNRFGYAYRTLQDHWEIGEMQYLLVKHQPTGRIQFQMDSYSKYDRIPNVFYRWGFQLLGRRLQKQFAQRCLVRLNEMVQERMRAN